MQTRQSDGEHPEANNQKTGQCSPNGVLCEFFILILIFYHTKNWTSPIKTGLVCALVVLHSRLLKEYRAKANHACRSAVCLRGCVGHYFNWSILWPGISATAKQQCNKFLQISTSKRDKYVSDHHITINLKKTKYEETHLKQGNSCNAAR